MGTYSKHDMNLPIQNEYYLYDRYKIYINIMYIDTNTCDLLVSTITHYYFYYVCRYIINIIIYIKCVDKLCYRPGAHQMQCAYSSACSVFLKMKHVLFYGLMNIDAVQWWWYVCGAPHAVKNIGFFPLPRVQCANYM